MCGVTMCGVTMCGFLMKKITFIREFKFLKQINLKIKLKIEIKPNIANFLCVFVIFKKIEIKNRKFQKLYFKKKLKNYFCKNIVKISNKKINIEF